MARNYRTHKGKAIDIEAIRAANEMAIAAGNMGVNAKGDKLGPGGEIIETTHDRVIKNYVKTPGINKKVSLKQEFNKKEEKEVFQDSAMLTPKKKPTKKAEKKTAKKKSTIKTAADGSKYKEVMDSDGNITHEPIKGSKK